jgi:hypothetical protein
MRIQEAFYRAEAVWQKMGYVERAGGINSGPYCRPTNHKLINTDMYNSKLFPITDQIREKVSDYMNEVSLRAAEIMLTNPGTTTNDGLRPSNWSGTEGIIVGAASAWKKRKQHQSQFEMYSYIIPIIPDLVNRWRMEEQIAELRKQHPPKLVELPNRGLFDITMLKYFPSDKWVAFCVYRGALVELRLPYILDLEKIANTLDPAPITIDAEIKSSCVRRGYPSIHISSFCVVDKL